MSAVFNDDERQAIELAGQVMGCFRRIAESNVAAGGRPVPGDLAEIAATVHVLQHAAAANAAARANEDSFRPFGSTWPFATPTRGGTE